MAAASHQAPAHDLLGQMARGELAISHDTFRALPWTERTTTCVNSSPRSACCPPIEARIERIPPWLDQKLAQLPADQADLVGGSPTGTCYADLRLAADRARLTKTMIDSARDRISPRSASSPTSPHRRHRGHRHPSRPRALPNHPRRQPGSDTPSSPGCAAAGINTDCTSPTPPNGAPAVTISDAQRWHTSNASSTTTPCAATPASADCSPCCSPSPCHASPHAHRQVTTTDSRATSPSTPSPSRCLPLDQIIRDHLHGEERASTPPATTAGSSPAAYQETPETENIRAQLVAIGIKPHESRKAALFQLAGEMPAPVLAELLGITDNNATDWATLAARDWTGYIAERVR